MNEILLTTWWSNIWMVETHFSARSLQKMFGVQVHNFLKEAIFIGASATVKIRLIMERFLAEVKGINKRGTPKILQSYSTIRATS